MTPSIVVAFLVGGAVSKAFNTVSPGEASRERSTI